jgi:hypothetical protein
MISYEHADHALTRAQQGKRELEETKPPSGSRAGRGGDLTRSFVNRLMPLRPRHRRGDPRRKTAEGDGAGGGNGAMPGEWEVEAGLDLQAKNPMAVRCGKRN